MKNLLIFIITNIAFSTLTAQTLSPGSYSSSDLGYKYSVNVKHEGNLITITEPNRINEYKTNGGNTYYHTAQKYANFYIKVAGTNKYYAGKDGSTQQLFTYTGSESNAENALPSGIDNCPLYDKYLNLSKTDHVNTQTWSFCGAAALAKCTYTDATEYIEPLIKALKSIMEDPSTCPCEKGAITKKEWEAVPKD